MTLLSIHIGTPVVPTDVSVQDITRDSGNVSWIISNVAITQESYSVNYGVNMSDLEMSSESISSRGESLTNQTYSVVLENLDSVTTYYYQVVSENDFSSSTSDIYSFTTLDGGIYIRPLVNTSHMYMHVCIDLCFPLPCSASWSSS